MRQWAAYPEREHRDRDQFQQMGKDWDLCARGLHSSNKFFGKYGLQQRQRILDRIVIYRILYANSISFLHRKSTGTCLLPSILVLLQDSTENRPTPILLFLLSIETSIIPSLVFLIPGIFLRFTYNSQFFPVKKCSQIIPGLLRIPVGWQPYFLINYHPMEVGTSNLE